jgi:hypothetical protein
MPTKTLQIPTSDDQADAFSAPGLKHHWDRLLPLLERTLVRQS